MQILRTESEATNDLRSRELRYAASYHYCCWNRAARDGQEARQDKRRYGSALAELSSGEGISIPILYEAEEALELEKNMLKKLLQKTLTMVA
ncbi:MAG: hypothetical protein AAB649_02145 [Patescibacteria group bacterium]